MRISDWSSDVCSSDLICSRFPNIEEMSQTFPIVLVSAIGSARAAYDPGLAEPARRALVLPSARPRLAPMISRTTTGTCGQKGVLKARRTSSGRAGVDVLASPPFRSEEHTSELP